MTAEPPLPDKWTKFTANIYMQARPPVLGTVDIKKIEEKAGEVMKDHLPAFMSIFGSAGTQLTDIANKKALESWKIIPKVLVDATNRNLETTILGVKLPAPLFIAPMGPQGILHSEGELATARAAADVGIPFIMSNSSSRSIEDIAAVNGPNGHRWYQFYWPRTSEIAFSILKRVKANGFTVLVITVDAGCSPWRPHDLETAYRPLFYGVGIQVGTSDPVFMKRFDLGPRQAETTPFPFEPEKLKEAAENGDEQVSTNLMLGRNWIKEANSGVFRTWEDLTFIRENWDGPIVLKGIQSVSDAEKAIAYGIEGIVVSNHGGRQLDGAIGSLDALDRIMRSSKVCAAQESGKLTVLFDSGIRTGSDIIKALAIGAQAVLIGRQCMYGLTIAGQEGVEQILRQTICDLSVSMGLTGYSDVNEMIGKRDEILTRPAYGI